MIDQEETQPATAKDMEGIDWECLKKMCEPWEQEEKRLRKLYLENPKRKVFFQHDFVEALWFHMIEYYGAVVGDEAMDFMTNELAEDDRLWQLVYDAAEKFAKEKGWKMK